MKNEKVGQVTLTEVAGSPFYYARYYRRGKQVTRSLRTKDIVQAKIQAEEISATLDPVRQRGRTDYSFEYYAAEVIARDERKVQRGERAPTLVTDQQRILKAYCRDSLGKLDVRKISHHTLQEFVDELTDRDLSSATIKVILVLVNKTMKAAVCAGVLSHPPIIPQVSLRQIARGWYSLKEYQKLLTACKRHEDAGTKVRTQVITNELRRFTTFMVNTFIRPSDAKLLRHRHIEIVKTKKTQFLRITTDFSKTALTPIISMPNAVPIYEKLLAASKAVGFGQPDDFIFMPKYKGRKFVIRTFSDQLRCVSESAGLALSPTGQRRTLYSLRHSAIMFRLIKGKDMCLLTLARNARTSVEMIDRFYASRP